MFCIFDQELHGHRPGLSRQLGVRMHEGYQTGLVAIETVADYCDKLFLPEILVGD